jgi:two-component system response regulator DesR
MIRVLLAEDQAMVRGALAALLKLAGDIEIVAEVGRGDQVVEMALATHPDVALLDIEMPGCSGLVAATALHAELPTCHVLILTTFDRPGYMRQALESGVAGFLLKDAPSAQLVTAIRQIVSGQPILDAPRALAALSAGKNPLTQRECDVLRAARNGASVAEIAASLVLSEGTVRNYLSEAIQKVGASNRVEAAYIAEQKGWL